MLEKVIGSLSDLMDYLKVGLDKGQEIYGQYYSCHGDFNLRGCLIDICNRFPENLVPQDYLMFTTMATLAIGGGLVLYIYSQGPNN